MAVPPDMLAALQAAGAGAPAGPAPAGPGGGPQDIPPDILAALQGAGGGAPDDVPSGALHGGSAAEGDPEEFYREALDALEQGMKADTDEARINTVMQCAAKIQGELANSQKGQDSMLGGKFDPAAMRRLGSADQAY